jgi:hypothetical protein
MCAVPPPAAFGQGDDNFKPEAMIKIAVARFGFAVMLAQ